MLSNMRGFKRWVNDGEPDPHYRQVIGDIHTYSNGAMSCHFDSEYSSVLGSKSVLQNNGATKQVPVPEVVSRDRLIVGTDSKRTYIRMHVLRFRKSVSDDFINKSEAEYRAGELQQKNESFEYVGCDDMNRYEGISFTPENMSKIIDVLKAMGAK